MSKVARFGLGGGTLPIGSRSRRVLNQSAHSRIGKATAPKLRHDPHRWIISGLDRALTVSPQDMVIAVADAANGWLDTRLRQPLRSASGEVLRTPVALMHEAAASQKTTFVQGLP